MADALALTEDDLVRMEHRARRFSGTLAADVMRLLAERRRLLGEVASLTSEVARLSQHRCRWGDDPSGPYMTDDYLDRLR